MARPKKRTAEAVVKDIKRQTRRKFKQRKMTKNRTLKARKKQYQNFNLN